MVVRINYVPSTEFSLMGSYAGSSYGVTEAVLVSETTMRQRREEFAHRKGTF